MRRPTKTSTSQQIRGTYGHDRDGKNYSQIARECGVSRSLVHAVLSRPLPPRAAVVRRRRPAAMQPVMARLPEEDLSRLPVLRNSRGQTLSSL